MPCPQNIIYVRFNKNIICQQNARALKAYKEFCETDVAPSHINAGATYAGILPCAVESGSDLYGGNPEGMPEGHGNAHQPDECINVDGFLKAVELILHMALECDMEHKKE